jgi:hypothetical protein
MANANGGCRQTQRLGHLRAATPRSEERPPLAFLTGEDSHDRTRAVRSAHPELADIDRWIPYEREERPGGRLPRAGPLSPLPPVPVPHRYRTESTAGALGFAPPPWGSISGMNAATHYRANVYGATFTSLRGTAPSRLKPPELPQPCQTIEVLWARPHQPPSVAPRAEPAPDIAADAYTTRGTRWTGVRVDDPTTWYERLCSMEVEVSEPIHEPWGISPCAGRRLGGTRLGTDPEIHELNTCVPLPDGDLGTPGTAV